MVCRGHPFVGLHQHAFLQATGAWKKAQAARCTLSAACPLPCPLPLRGEDRLSNIETVTGHIAFLRRLTCFAVLHRRPWGCP